jgi:murein DD-endopeptidase MepM/ murein hydrolase activator NlpD
MGAPVKAIYDAEVVYSGYDSKFGNLVITKLKEGDFYAAFAHLDDLNLAKGQQILQGDVIGHVGQSGNVSAPQLYIAIKKGKMAINPAPYFGY